MVSNFPLSRCRHFVRVSQIALTLTGLLTVRLPAFHVAAQVSTGFKCDSPRSVVILAFMLLAQGNSPSSHSEPQSVESNNLFGLAFRLAASRVLWADLRFWLCTSTGKQPWSSTQSGARRHSLPRHHPCRLILRVGKTLSVLRSVQNIKSCCRSTAPAR